MTTRISTGSDLPVCLIAGVGDATGASLVRRFTAGGYRVAMLARNAGRLNTLAAKVENTRAFPCDVGELNSLLATVDAIRSKMGSPAILIHNAVSHTFGTFLDSDPGELERNFRVNTTSLLYLARAVAPDMIAAGKGAIMVTGNTASHRGIPNYALFAPTKAAQRVLSESLARDLGPKGIHVGYVTTDAAIDVTWLGPETARPHWLVPPSDWQKPREDFFADPDAIANEVFHMAHQDRSTWAFDLVIRPYAEKW